MFKTFIFAAALVGAATSANAVTNLLVNPSFEMGPAAEGTVLAAGNTDITGWTVIGGGVFLAGPSEWDAAAGDRSVRLFGTGAGSIGQLVAVEAGEQYELTFSYAADPRIGVEGNPAFGLVSFDTANAPITFTRIVGQSPTNVGWLEDSYIFTAPFTGDVLVSFNSGSDNAEFAIAVDAISLAVVPEPATWAMLIAGFGMVGFSMRRRRVTLTSVTN